MIFRGFKTNRLPKLSRLADKCANLKLVVQSICRAENNLPGFVPVLSSRSRYRSSSIDTQVVRESFKLFGSTETVENYLRNNNGARACGVANRKMVESWRSLPFLENDFAGIQNVVLRA